MNASNNEAFLLVDGYNIIGSWPSLQKTSDRKGLDSARLELISALINYTSYQGYKTEIVFDAHYQKTPACVEKHSANLSVYYTDFGKTADTYIEKICASFFRSPSKSFNRLIVATSDRAQQLTAIGYGAECISAQRLEAEVDLTSRQFKRRQRPVNSSGGRFLFNSLDPKSQKLFAEWRQGIR